MTKIALLIGVSDYEPGLSSLPCSVKDVEAMRQVLVNPDIGAFLDSDITVLTNPGRQNMEEEIEKLFSNRHKDDLVLLFFSGHGIKDDTGKLYLATRQTRKTPQGDLIRSSTVAASFIHDNMDRSRSKRQIVILDSCFSGAFAVGLSAKDDGTVNIFEQLGGEGRAVLTSSSSTQYSFEHLESDLSIYTTHLVAGMTTGTADLNEDGFVSIGELHEYARQKVKESYPAMKPEIYPGKEGYTIRLCKVPRGDPKEKYRKEVERYISHGEVTFVGRKILDAQRNRLNLSEAEATAIEEEILAGVRQEFHEKLQRYEDDFTDALQQKPPLNEDQLELLRQNLKQILGLWNEDIQPIEQRVRTRIETYAQHLRQYEQAFTEAIGKEQPLNAKARDRLQQMQQQWELTAGDISSLESRITAEIEAYRQKLQQYETAYRKAAQEYPLSEQVRQTLRKEQKQLAVKTEDITQIETQVKAEIEAYGQNLKDYEQALEHIIQREKVISDESREELKRYQVVLELRDEDTAQVEAEIVSKRKIMHVTDEESESSKRITGTQKDRIDVTPENQSRIVRPNKENHKESLEYKEASEQYKKKTATLGKFVNLMMVFSLLVFILVLKGNKPSSYEKREAPSSSESTVPSSHQMTAQDYFNRGYEKGEKKDYKGAITDYDQAIKLNPDYAAAYNNRGIAKGDLGDNEGGIPDYDQAIKLNPDYADAYNNRGVTKRDLGDKKGAIADYDQAIKLNPDYAVAYTNRGNAKDDLGDKKGAIADYDQAIKLNPDYADAYNNRGLAKLNLGHNKGAIADFDQAIKLNPDYAVAYTNRGNAKDDLGDKKGAIADYDQAIKLNPDDAVAYFNRGLAKRDLGNNKGAIADYQQAAKLYKAQGNTKDYQDALLQIKNLQ